jgi:hypothetical protein
MKKPNYLIISILRTFSKLICVLAFVLFSTVSYAQIKQTARIEFESQDVIDEEHVLFPLRENGVVVLHSKTESLKRNLSIDFYKYDSTLTQIWMSTFEPDKEFELIKTFDNEHFIYILLKKEAQTNIGILRIDLATGDKTYIEGNLLTNIDIEHFKVLKSKVFIGGQYNERPVIVMFSLFDKTSKILPEIHANHLQINDINVNEQTENIYVMLKNEKTCQYHIKTYNYEGKVIKNLILGDKSKTPITGEILDKTDGNLVLTGSYAEGCSLYSMGLYLYDISEKDAQIQYFNFADFNNFFGYLNEKREAKVKHRIKEKKNKGKEVKLRYRLIQHNIIPTPDGWMMVAEIFYPEYKYPTNNLIFGNWRNYRIGNEIYNNFRYMQAIICFFDKKGKLIWDNSISLNNLESNTLLEKVQVSVNDDKIILAYPDNNKIKTTLIQKNQKAKILEVFDLKSANDTLTITDTKELSLAAWYGNHFLSYGYQNVKKSNDLLNKSVFYISKLAYTIPPNLPNRQ